MPVRSEELAAVQSIHSLLCDLTIKTELGMSIHILGPRVLVVHPLKLNLITTPARCEKCEV